MYEDILDRLLSWPQRGAIRIHFDLKKKKFILSAPIYSSRAAVPQSLCHYVKARKDLSFRPHATSFQLEEKRVVLQQEIPFVADFQETLRKHIDDFWQLSKQCHKMLAEIAAEEVYGKALHLDSHSPE